MTNMDFYDFFRSVPADAKRPIEAGRLKGFTDINPMWRIKILTELFGPCGIGWWYKITDKRIETFGTEMKAFVDIELYYTYGDERGDKVSHPVVGTGGAPFVSMEKNGPYVSDECFKMALTDAISVATKSLGVGADVYYEKDRDKYVSKAEPEQKPDKTVPKTYYCSECNKEITMDEAKYSYNKYKRLLCRDCQKKA